MFVQALTLFHVALSLVGIAAGFVVAYDFLAHRRRVAWHHVFLLTTAATTLTGFFFPFKGFTPAIGLGIVSTPVLAVALYAYYGARLAGRWNAAYIVTALLAQYFDVFALVVQSFMKIPALHALAPTQAEPPFLVAQLAVLVGFVALTISALRKAHAAPPLAKGG